MGRYARLDLLCLDEAGYVHLDPRGAELLFQIITAREERVSIACASNPRHRPAAGRRVVDRLTFRAHIIDAGTESYRLRPTRAGKTSRPRSIGKEQPVPDIPPAPRGRRVPDITM